MKNILQLLVNLIAWWQFSVFSFFGILWYGKLPKISFYHWAVRSGIYTAKGIYNDVNHQVISVEDVPKKVQDRIIKEYINQLYDNDKFRANIIALDVPLFDGKKVYGSGSVIDIFNEAKDEYLTK